MTITEARQAIADAMNTVPGLNVRPSPVRTNKALDGWVNVKRAEPAGFRTAAVTFGVVVLLGTDASTAEGRIDTLTVAVLDALTQSVPCADLSVAPVLLSGPDGDMYALEVNLVMEI